MNKLLLLLTLGLSLLMSNDIPLETSQMRNFSKSIEVNAQIIQLQNTRQTLMSLIGGHIENYYVKAGQKVVVNQKIALIDSMILSQMTAEYLSLEEQYKALNENYLASEKLYNQGMLALQAFKRQGIEKKSVASKRNKIKSQLLILGINAEALTQASSSYILYSHSDGVVNEILQPLHSVINDNTPIVSIVKQSSVYAKAYVPLRYAGVLKIGQKGELSFAQERHTVTLTQILPEVESQTQRASALFAIDDRLKGPHINAFVPLSIYFDTNESYVSVKKSALSFFQNEWVVFVPKAIEEHAQISHEEMKHDEDDEHEEEEHEEDGAEYEVRVVDIITQNSEYAAIKGLSEGEKYVSDKSYYVKSMLLKSSLGGHGH